MYAKEMKYKLYMEALEELMEEYGLPRRDTLIEALTEYYACAGFETGFYEVFVEMTEETLDRLSLSLSQIFESVLKRFIFTEVYRRIWCKACLFDGFFGTQSIKFQPDIFPGLIGIRNICTDLIWENHKALSAFYMVRDRLSAFIICMKNAGTGYNIMK